LPNLRDVGRRAEDRAAEYLLGQGFTIVTRRYKAKHGELDLVALEGDLLVFVEVKERRAPGYIPEESIGDAKRRALFLAGQEYLREMGEPEREARFDLIAMDAQGIRHHRDVLAV
jgi:putative endonuclease